MRWIDLHRVFGDFEHSRSEQYDEPGPTVIERTMQQTLDEDRKPGINAGRLSRGRM